jgi:hypothetical protein
VSFGVQVSRCIWHLIWAAKIRDLLHNLMGQRRGIENLVRREEVKH